MRKAWTQVAGIYPEFPRYVLLAWVFAVVAAMVEALLLVALARVLVAMADSQPDVVFLGVQLTVLQLASFSAAGGVTVLLLHAADTWATSRLEARGSLAARERALETFSRASEEWQRRQGEGSLQAVLTVYAPSVGAAAMALGTGIAFTTSLAVMIGAAALIDLWATAVIAVASGLFYLMLRPFAIITARRSATYTAAVRPIADHIGQLSRMRRELRVFGAEAAAVGDLREEYVRATDALQRMRWASRYAGLAYRDLAIVFVLIGVVGVTIAQTIDLALAGTVALILLRSLVYGQMTQLARQQLAEARPGLNALAGYVADGASHVGTHVPRAPDSWDRVELLGVTYLYGDSGVGVRDATFNLERGEVFGVFGSSGSGKSTVADLVLRLRTPQTGSIRVGGADYREIADDEWQRAVAFVPQEAGLLEATAMDNIRLYRSWITDEQVLWAAEAAHVAEVILQLPAGFATRLGPEGSGLSVGQRQRIALARALAGSPQVLVLDEPTSALDPESRDLVAQTIAQAQASAAVLLISHDPRMLAGASRLGEMRRGVLQTDVPKSRIPIDKSLPEPSPRDSASDSSSSPQERPT